MPPRRRVRRGQGSAAPDPPYPPEIANGCGHALKDANALQPSVLLHYRKGGIRGQIGYKQTMYCHHF
eukprot:SAG31_NODE_42270_length_272_cov_0.890173_1_plen_66_part_10